MPKHYVLIDYENVQPETLARLDPKRHAIMVFVGANQPRMATSLVTAMQRFECHCIQIAGSGRNALDLHIAYYVGRIAAAEPGTSFHVVSKDAGFDPLMRYLQLKGIAAHRIATIDGIVEASRVSRASKASASLLDPSIIIDNLKRRPKARPRTVGKLYTVIHELFLKKLKDEDVTRLVDQLVERGAVTVEGTKVSYKL
ncbi:MAG TPA: PIN domain-containing protein [Dongiaceae bacterium]|nr:PIN domain-containing protein [Dongiaceae bacterium]